MKLLFDQNLSPRLVTLFDDLYPDSTHVSSVGLDSALDYIVWEFARDNGYVIASKDSDLSEIGMIRGFPPSVVWIRRGNCSTQEIDAILRSNRTAIENLDRSEPGGILLLY